MTPFCSFWWPPPSSPSSLVLWSTQRRAGLTACPSSSPFCWWHSLAQVRCPLPPVHVHARHIRIALFPGNNYNKEKQFRSLRNDAADMVKIRVLRNGDNEFVQVKEIVVGDIVHLETGDKIVADGIFISGSNGEWRAALMRR